MDAIQIATLAGTAVGSMLGSYFVAVHATRRGREEYARESLPAPYDTELRQRVERLERELHDEVRTVDTKLAALAAETLTVEEFQAYVTMDGERRERLIAKLAELQGNLAAVLPRRR